MRSPKTTAKLIQRIIVFKNNSFRMGYHFQCEFLLKRGPNLKIPPIQRASSRPPGAPRELTRRLDTSHPWFLTRPYCGPPSTYTLSKRIKRIDGTYTRLLRTALNVSWRQHLTSRQLYGNLPPVSSVIQVRRLQFAGHCYRSKYEVVNRVILWEPRHGRRSKGRPAKSYINILAADTGAERSELPGLMGNREQWKTIVDSARARSTE